MRVIVGAVLALVLVAAVSVAAAEEKYGAGVTLKTATTVATLMANPKEYVGKAVRVDGVVTAVCDMAGCWMEVRDETADPAAAKTIRIKVEDGVIVFPVSAKGKKASIQGVLEPVSAEMAKEYAADQAKAKPGSDMKTAVPTYQLKGTGAIIY
jgi:Domain of unknown function (DUF4920)